MALLRGDLGASLALHPFALLIAVEGAAAWVLLAVTVGRGRNPALPFGVERWVLAHVAVLMALWLGRLASGSLPF